MNTLWPSIPKNCKNIPPWASIAKLPPAASASTSRFKSAASSASVQVVPAMQVLFTISGSRIPPLFRQRESPLVGVFSILWRSLPLALVFCDLSAVLMRFTYARGLCVLCVAFPQRCGKAVRHQARADLAPGQPRAGCGSTWWRRRGWPSWQRARFRSGHISS